MRLIVPCLGCILFLEFYIRKQVVSSNACKVFRTLWQCVNGRTSNKI